MRPLEIIEKYYQKNTPLYEILISHSISVAQKAFQIIENIQLDIDKKFVQEAAMLHDIGIFLTNAPSIHCFGTHNYIEHGYLGAELLRAENLPKHALVCERHTGAGISLEDIQNNNLPLPHCDFQPQTWEEKIICFADKFYSKTQLYEELPIEKIRANLSNHGQKPLEQFDQWASFFML